MRTNRARLVALLTALCVALGVVALGPSTVAYAGTSSITGFVSLGTEGNTAAAGEVRVYYRTAVQSIDESRSVLTDASGGYFIGLLEADTYYLFFEYLGTAGYDDKWYRQVAAETIQNIGFYVPANTNWTTVHDVLTLPGAISGTVALAGTTDLPAAGDVLVSYVTYSGHSTYSAESVGIPVSAGGGYVLPDMPAGKYALFFTYVGSGPFQRGWYEPVVVSPGATTTRNFVQPGLVTLQGSVYVGNLQAAPGSFRIEFERLVSGVWSAIPGSAQIVANGRFSMPGLQSVPHRATLTYLGTDGHAQVTTVFGGTGGMQPSDFWEVNVPRAVNVGGTIYLGDNNVKAGAGEVQVEYRRGGTLVKSALTNANGTYAVRNLPVLGIYQTYDVTIRYLGTRNIVNSLASVEYITDYTNQDFLLDSTAWISGHVSLGSAGTSAGAGEVRVSFGLRSAVTDASGNYRISGMNNGVYKLELQYLGSGDYADEWWPGKASHEYAAGIYVDGSGVVKDVQLADSGSISGRVTVGGVAPPGVVGVWAHYSVPPTGNLPGHRVSVEVLADSNGYYTFDRLRPEQYTLEFFHYWTLGENQMWGGTPLNTAGETFNLAAGDALTKDTNMGGGTISGLATCPTCGTPGFWNTVDAKFGIEYLDPLTNEWMKITDGYLTMPSASFSTYVQYPGTYRVFASYAYSYAYVNPVWGQGYSAPFVVNGADVTTSVVMELPESSRIGGQDRFDVSASISQMGFAPGVPVVYIADGMNYPDALSAAPAAARQGGPLLLVTTHSIPAAIASEIQRLQPQKIVVVGGPGSVSPAVYQQLSLMVPTVGDITRLGGTDRYAASRSVARYAFDLGSTTTAYVTTGNNFPDALSAGGAASMRDAPVITVDGNASRIDSETRQLLIDLGVSVVRIAGGPGSVSAGIAASIDALPGVTVVRLWGQDRYEASGAINRDAFTEADTVFLSVGTKYPDALSGGALAGLWDAPLYVIPSDCIPYYVLEDIREWSPEQVIVLGGPGSVEPGVLAFRQCPR